MNMDSLGLTHARGVRKIDSPFPEQPAPVKGLIVSSKQVLRKRSGGMRRITDK
jgi:hypothetical protein